MNLVAEYITTAAPCSSGRQISGRLLIDEEILRESGVTEFGQYRFDRESDAALMPDLFID